MDFYRPYFVCCVRDSFEIYSVVKSDWQTSCAFVFVGYVHVVGDRGNFFVWRQVRMLQQLLRSDPAKNQCQND